MNRYSKWNKIMLFVVYLARHEGEGVRKFVHSFYTWTITYIEYRNKKNEYQSWMNIFAHFKDIDSQCTQQTNHNKLFLLIINQFHFYYYQGDHYSRRSIERVVMHFFKNPLFKCMKGMIFFQLLHIASSFFIYRDAMCKDSKQAVLFYCGQESWWFPLCSSLSLPSGSLTVCVTTIITLCI